MYSFANFKLFCFAIDKRSAIAAKGASCVRKRGCKSSGIIWSSYSVWNSFFILKCFDLEYQIMHPHGSLHSYRHVEDHVPNLLSRASLIIGKFIFIWDVCGVWMKFVEGPLSTMWDTMSQAVLCFSFRIFRRFFVLSFREYWLCNACRLEMSYADLYSSNGNFLWKETSCSA